MEMFVYHADLHEITRLIVEAHVTLELGEGDDFQRAMSSIGELTDHLVKEEKLRLPNIF
jgi:hypothetical protein